MIFQADIVTVVIQDLILAHGNLVRQYPPPTFPLSGPENNL